MEEFVITIMNQYGYFGIFFLIFIENIFPPIPSEVVLLFGGFMTTYSKLGLPLMIVFSTLGSTVGAIVLYYIGKILNKERLKRIVSGKVGKVLRLKTSDIDKADFCRFIPVVRSLISIPAGMSEMQMGKFLLYTVVGSAIWNTVLLFAGNKVGKNWKSIVNIMSQYSHIILVILVIGFVGFVIYHFSNKKNKKKSS